MTVTHTDGFPVRHTETDALLLGMGERYDVLVTAGDGVFPLTALAEGKGASALAVLRTGTGALPPASVRPAELDGELVTADRLAPDESVALAEREPDRTVRITLTGSMAAYDWGFDGKSYDPAARSPSGPGSGCAWSSPTAPPCGTPSTCTATRSRWPATGQGAGLGARKDTAAILPGRTLTVDFDADNPGLWMLHCHNVYHAEAGMMTVLGYLR